MTARGVLYAIAGEHEAEMLQREGQQEALVAYLDNLWDEDWQIETDKAWDEIHRTLGNGELDHTLSEPLSEVIFGGRVLSAEDWFIIVHKQSQQVIETAKASAEFTDDQFRERYLSRTYLFDVEPDWGGALCLFRQIRWFYSKAVDAGRAVVFAVDQ